MDLQIFSNTELITVLRALRAVAVANDKYTKAERDFLEAIARIHGSDIDADYLDPITFDEVKRRVVSARSRKRTVQLAIAMALVEGEPSGATDHAVQKLASALGVDRFRHANLPFAEVRANLGILPA